MTFIAQAWLLLGALGVAVLLLHVRRRRTLAVPSIQLWRLAESANVARHRIRLPASNLLLLLQLLIVAVAALALARPLLGPSARFEHEIVVLDASGDMRSTDVAPSRFDAALAHLATMAQGPVRESGARLSVLTAGAPAKVVAARLADPKGLDLGALRAGDGDADWSATIRFASSLTREGEPTRLTLITNAARPDVMAAAFPGVTVETRIVGGQVTRNAGLQATLRAVDAAKGRWRAEGSVTFSAGFAGPTTVTALVQPEGSDGFLPWASVDVVPPPAVAAGRSTTAAFALDFDLRVSGLVTLRLPEDVSPHDNAVDFVVHLKPRTLRVLQLGAVSEPLTRALRAAADIELFTADVLPPETGDFDLVVVNGTEIPRHPTTNVLWLGAARITGEAGGRPRAPSQSTLWKAGHPLSQSIAWSAVEVGTTYGFPGLPGAEAIVEADGAPLIEARTALTGREVRVALDLARSSWPDQPSFPIFVSNLLRWIAPDLGHTIERPCIVGTSCALDPRLIGAEAVLVSPEPVTTTAVPSAIPSSLGFLPRGYDLQFVADRAGIYRFQRDGLTRFVAVNADHAVGADDKAAPGGSVPRASGAADRLPVRWWLLVALFVLLLVEGCLAGRGAERYLWRSALARGNPLALRRRLLLAARLVTLLLVAAAIAGVPLLMPDRSRNVVVVAGPRLDAGGSAAARLDQIAVMAHDEKARGGDPRLGVVTIDASSHIVTDLRTKPERNPATAPPIATAANLEDALAVAAAMLPANKPGRVIVASDGNETRGNAARLLPDLVRRAVKVDVLPTTERVAGEVLVEDVTAPDRVYAGDTFPLEAVVYSHGRSTAKVQVLKDGNIIVERSLELADGRSRIDTPIPGANAGRSRYEVVVSADGDRFEQNNRGGVAIDVAPAPQVLLVAAQPAWGEVFAKALAVQDIKTKIVEPKRAPFYLKDWLAYSAVVLMNVPAIDLATLQQELIEKAVAEHGRGLLLLGGENSFGPGGYYETPLERVSPLSSRVPRDAPRVALVFVLDRSGSMQRNEGGATRLDIAKQATVSAIRLLHPESQIAIVVFDSEARVLLPLGPAKDSAAVAQALQTLEPGGGTAIYPGLVEALQQLQGVEATAKHIVVMSDGLTQPGDFPGILKAISDQGISVSTVAIGDGADPVRLEEIARMGKGAFHATQDFKALPSILSQEALLLSGKPVEERSTPPAWVRRNGEFFAGLPDRLPPVAGYVLTTLKPQADLHLVVPDAKQEPVPLLASWHYGNGRVIALTTQGAGTWTQAWQAMAEYPLLWSQTLRQVFPGQGEGLLPHLMRHGDEVDVVVDALDQDGAPREGLKVSAALSLAGRTDSPLLLSETSPGRYQERFMPDGPGEYSLRAVADQAAAEAPFWIAYPAVYAFTRADPDRLMGLSAVTGGSVLTSEKQIFDGSEARWVARDLWQVWILAALALFMVDLMVRYAGGLIGTRAAKRGARGAA
jgi:uncharacterized protein YegL